MQNYLRAALISSHLWPDWLADVTGLMTVHVIRAMKTLRTDGLVRLDDRQLVIQNWRRLYDAAEFDPTYLPGELR
ncbi:hypothetical protein B2G69_07015 [Methylorubrum zatmanii]|nr:hypothetical protein B2G69_07015 [Methylorubrum zatmanii]